MSIEGQGHFFTIYFPGFVCFVLYWAKISGERLQDHWSSGFSCDIYQLPANNSLHRLHTFLILSPFMHMIFLVTFVHACLDGASHLSDHF